MRRKVKKNQHQHVALDFKICPAKTYQNSIGAHLLGRTVFNHCQIVGHLAQAILQRLPEAIRSQLFPEGVALLAACHDIGKVSPTFFIKLHKHVKPDWHASYPDLKQYAALNEAQWGGHAGVSALTLKALACDTTAQKVVGQHHGFQPPVELHEATGDMFGGVPWQEQRTRLYQALQTEFKSHIPSELSSAQVLAISGLTSVADWIGSSSIFHDPKYNWEPLIERSLANAGFKPFVLKPKLTFTDVFGFAPRSAQATFIEATNRAGVYILEAPMGLGKTEAALYAAYQMLERQEATGIYFALPTQLTSNKIFDRFNDFLTRILDETCPHKQALLLHGQAWLQETEMGEEGAMGRSWFKASKRGLLAPFAVGTIDQALMSVLNVRHGFVRAFGLTGKVVILDEVHSYDTYTGVLLDKLVALLRSLHCTVVILSATLNQERRTQLLNESVTSQAYPLVTALPNQGAYQEISIDPLPTTTVHVHLQTDHAEALEEALQRAEAGQQVLWIENTVQAAQTRYFDAAARCQELNIACGLLHSRYTPADREQLESKWVDALGKTGWVQRQQQGRLLIGTQVLEQSLDIDADFLVSMFAPTDMLLQRIGRLWRHTDTPRPPSAHCETWLLVPEPASTFGSSGYVYSDYVLHRSLEVWQQQQAERPYLQLPDDIRPLIDATYAEREESGLLANLKYVLHEGHGRRKGIRQLRQLALSASAMSTPAQSDQNAQTRYSEEDSAAILLLRSIQTHSHKHLTQITLLSGETLTIPWQKQELTQQQWLHISRQLMRNMVPCRESKLPQRPQRDRCLQLGLGHALYLGCAQFHDTVPFAMAIQTIDGELQGFETDLSDRYHYVYQANVGLQIEKIEG